VCERERERERERKKKLEWVSERMCVFVKVYNRKKELRRKEIGEIM
jgi:hypothetical protein